jgi:hypothetical protein
MVKGLLAQRIPWSLHLWKLQGPPHLCQEILHRDPMKANEINTHTHTHTHRHSKINVSVFFRVCVCVCVCVSIQISYFSHAFPFFELLQKSGSWICPWATKNKKRQPEASKFHPLHTPFPWCCQPFACDLDLKQPAAQTGREWVMSKVSSFMMNRAEIS